MHAATDERNYREGACRANHRGGTSSCFT